jgi:hypothetical protein
MSVHTESAAKPARMAVTAAVSRLRRGSLAALVLVVLEYAIGAYVSLYVAVPAADHGRGLSTAISNGPVPLSVHAVVGPLLGLAALGVLVQSVVARRWPVAGLSAVGLLAVALACVAGAGFVRTGETSASMAMSVLTGIALLCYALNLYVLGPASGAGKQWARKGG